MLWVGETLGNPAPGDRAFNHDQGRQHSESDYAHDCYGPGTGSDALPAKEEVSALVQSMPGVADDDYDDIADAKEARNKIVKSIGGFVKSAVKRSAAKIADALTDSTLAPLGSCTATTSRASRLSRAR